MYVSCKQWRLNLYIHLKKFAGRFSLKILKNIWKKKEITLLKRCAQSLSHVWFFAIPWTVACQAPWNSPGKNTGVGCHFLFQLGSITTSKTNGGDGIPAEIFKILKDDVVKMLHSICQQIWKTQQWPLRQENFSFHSNQKEGQYILKNI